MHTIARTLNSALTCLSHRQRLGLLALLVAGTGLLLAGCASTRPPPGVTAVTPFDLQRYAGRWYELARLDHAFERTVARVDDTKLHDALHAAGLEEVGVGDDRLADLRRGIREAEALRRVDVDGVDDGKLGELDSGGCGS